MTLQFVAFSDCFIDYAKLLKSYLENYYFDSSGLRML